MTKDKTDQHITYNKRMQDEEQNTPFHREDQAPNENQEFPVNPSNEPNDLAEGLIDPE
ncbi:hypothetical protein HZY86_04485 [Aerococcaceae bacterium DSM 111020]|nr:hypothetical protein [Aerococcaceae bacterium DSM 111020]